MTCTAFDPPESKVNHLSQGYFFVGIALIRPCKTCMSIDNIYPNKIIEPIHTSQMCVIVIQGCFYIVCI